MPRHECPVRRRTPILNSRSSTIVARLLCAAVSPWFTCLETASATEGVSKPNVLLIYTDDQGTVDLGCYGSDDLETPHLDALAARGVRFTQMYAPAAVCSPSRAGLMTGRFPARAGVPGNVSSTHGDAGMPVDEVTIADMLATAGYATAHVGKWHLGYDQATMPRGQGFDSSFGHMGGCIDNFSHFFYWSGPNRHDLWRDGREVWHDGRFFGDLMVDECRRFLDAHRSGPFFIYWAINMPHYPLHGSDKWREFYAERGLPSPRDKYAAFVSTADEMIGQVLAILDELNLRERTLVIFQSDHGHSTEERTFFGGGSAGPYRGAKFSLFEGGIRVPAIVSMPGSIPEGQVRDQLATGCDWLPTIAELCGAPLPAKKLDGKSLVDVIVNAEAPSAHKTFYWQMGAARTPDTLQTAVRDGDWKLITNARDTSSKAQLSEEDRLFLANLAEDASEMTNLASRHPDVVERLVKLRDAYFADVQQERPADQRAARRRAARGE